MVGVVGYLVYLQPFMAIIILGVFLPQMIFVPLIQLSINRNARERISTVRAASIEAIGETIERSILVDQQQRYSRIFQLNMGIFKLKFSLNFLMNLTHPLGITLILSLGAWLVINGKTEIGTIVAFISGLSTVKDPWGDLVSWFQNLMVTVAKYQFLFDAIGAIAVGPPSATNDCSS
jgi:ABC-type bacteriocin/lantibiotic exporter with double-glycine peptidase domain